VEETISDGADDSHTDGCIETKKVFLRKVKGMGATKIREELGNACCRLEYKGSHRCLRVPTLTRANL
jgi:hypothetical protein